MVKLTINGHEVEVPEGTTVLQATKMLGIEVPVFCYHPKLPIAGNCRMCLVEMEKSPKPVASCAMPAGEGMVIHTNTPLVEKARKGVLEFLLINHPLDCPICDQGGECDLQDITLNYGPDHSRYEENKRAVTNKEMGPLIKTIMTRCIHCTRCVRFATDIAGVPEMGAVGRGEHMEITPYIEEALDSELAGNMIDICPVGALTSKPYAFQARPWELTSTESIDVMDAVGSHIRVDSKGGQVMRILPRLCEDINEDWLSDKARFSYDGLKNQRLDRPYVRVKGKLQPASWDEAFAAIGKALKGCLPSEIGLITGDQADAEAMVAAKDFMHSLGSGNIDCRQDGVTYTPAHRSHYLFNTTIKGIEKADACLLIGSFPRWEAPLINARLRKTYLANGLKVAYVGKTPNADFTFPVEQLGSTQEILEQLISGKHPFGAELKKANLPMIILGQGALKGNVGAATWNMGAEIAEKYTLIKNDWNGFNVLHIAAARVGGLDLGVLPSGKGALDTHGMVSSFQEGTLKFLYLLGADEVEVKRGKGFIVYQGHHGDKGAQVADVILPGAAYTEKSGTYVNTEGRVQRTQQGVFPPGEAKEDWRIFKALSDHLARSLPYTTLEGVRKRLCEVNPIFAYPNEAPQLSLTSIKGKSGKSSCELIGTSIDNYYMTDPISRHSTTMAKCTTARQKRCHHG